MTRASDFQSEREEDFEGLDNFLLDEGDWRSSRFNRGIRGGRAGKKFDWFSREFSTKEVWQLLASVVCVVCFSLGSFVY